ncbi:MULTISPECIES: urea transporter [unclassified Janthinobacterium]|uniref:urea transporter n=1 Tax=unclassified Janthinobacterium TaxID=2610881 RepID=UPI000345B3F4|nr:MULTISPECIES: urea transporter [unclassified Janthinobacterium]MEC5159407.1 urea transporter [Janthinobacterium sp. CG_S6]
MSLRTGANSLARAGAAPAAAPRLPTALLASVAQVYFQQAPLSGAALLLCLWLSSPAMALGCLLGAAGAIAAACAARRPGADIEQGLYSYNGALGGAALAALYQPTPALLAWIAGGAVATAAATHLFLRRGGAPALTAPFVLLMLAAAALGPAAGLQAQPAGAGCGGGRGLAGYAFCVIGQINFIDSLALGALLLAALSQHDWRYGAWAMAAAALAWYLLTLGQLWPQAGSAAQATGMGVNCVLAVLGLRAQRRGRAARVLGGLGAIAFSLALGKLGLPYFTLPFVLATWVTLYLSRPRTSTKITVKPA